MKVQPRIPVFEAFQWLEDADDANDFFGENYGIDWEYISKSKGTIEVKLEHGHMLLRLHDWVVTNDQGAFVGYDDDLFHKTFEEVVPCETS